VIKAKSCRKKFALVVKLAGGRIWSFAAAEVRTRKLAFGEPANNPHCTPILLALHWSVSRGRRMAITGVNQAARRVLHG